MKRITRDCRLTPDEIVKYRLVREQIEDDLPDLIDQSKQSLLDQFREIEKKAAAIIPVVDCRWGYAAFVAYVFKIDNGDKPSEYWVGEMGEDREVAAIKRICQY